MANGLLGKQGALNLTARPQVKKLGMAVCSRDLSADLSAGEEEASGSLELACWSALLTGSVPGS